MNALSGPFKPKSLMLPKKNFGPTFGSSSTSNPFASLTDYAHAWHFTEGSAGSDAADVKGTMNLTQVNSPVTVGGGGRTTNVTGNKYFIGSSNLDLSSSWTMAGWYFLSADSNVPIFSNRDHSSVGQFVVYKLTTWQIYFYNDGFLQKGPYANTTDTTYGGWRFMVVRHTLATKTLSISIDNGAATGSDVYTFVVSPNASPLGFGGDAPPTTAAGTISLRYWYQWNRVITAGEEAALYAAGSLGGP